jgi:uncharacterized protein (DUF342 family)
MGWNVVLATDNEAIQHLFRKTFELRRDIHLTFCQTAAQTSDEVIKSPPHLLAISVNLPDKEGYELCRELKEQGDIQFPILLIEDIFEDIDLEKCVEVHTDGFIAKPFEEDLIAEKIPGEEGSPGMDIYGRLIPPPLPQKIKLSPGEGAKTSEDGLKVFSTLNGTPKIMPDGRLCVLPTIKIDGDVGVETGHVEFDGHIDVSGAVQKGYKVKGKSLQAREINHAEIEIDEDIVVFRGIYGSDIKGGGDLKASHIHHSSIDVLGDVIVEKEIFESQIETNGKCVIGGGTVITSEISAKKGIIAHDIGTLAAKPSSLTVGIDHKLQRELSNIKKKIAEETQKKTELEDLIPPLRERSDKLNTELGEIAVEQDKYMVQQREIEERLKDPHSQLDDDTKEKQVKVIQALMLKRNEIDGKVAELLNEDEEIDQISIDELVAKFNRTTAEIEKCSALRIPLERLALAKIVSKPA